MATFFYKENEIYETREAVEAAAKNFVGKGYDSVETDKSFVEFEAAYEELREAGCSSADAFTCAASHVIGRD